MKLYKVVGVKQLNECASVGMRRWVGSQAAAATIRKTWVKGGMHHADISTTEVDVPTDKKGLIEFLNESQVK